MPPALAEGRGRAVRPRRLEVRLHQVVAGALRGKVTPDGGVSSGNCVDGARGRRDLASTGPERTQNERELFIVLEKAVPVEGEIEYDPMRQGTACSRPPGPEESTRRAMRWMRDGEWDRRGTATPTRSRAPGCACSRGTRRACPGATASWTTGGRTAARLRNALARRSARAVRAARARLSSSRQSAR